MIKIYKNMVLMSKTYYFRKDKLGFIDWARFLPERRTMIKEYGNLSSEMKMYRLDQYKSAIKVINQYDILMHSLTPEQKKYWHKRFVKWETPTWNDKESFYMEDLIYENWLKIIINTQDKFKFPSPKIVSSILKEMRTKSGYSIRQVAGILDVNDKTIQRYECGLFYPRIDVLYSITKIYGYSFEELINITFKGLQKK